MWTGELGSSEDPEFLYYMNEGVYGPFSHKLLGNSIPAPAVHKVSRPPHKRGHLILLRIKHLIAALAEKGN